ncbi:hypothetical protein A2U01_0093535, partial [Trifolium medium]|nr:hypothetical protein [Trifolium medium]
MSRFCFPLGRVSGFATSPPFAGAGSRFPVSHFSSPVWVMFQICSFFFSGV